jgi:hypothetical protein
LKVYFIDVLDTENYQVIYLFMFGLSQIQIFVIDDESFKDREIAFEEVWINALNCMSLNLLLEEGVDAGQGSLKPIVQVRNSFSHKLGKHLDQNVSERRVFVEHIVAGGENSHHDVHQVDVVLERNVRNMTILTNSQ